LIFIYIGTGVLLIGTREKSLSKETGHTSLNITENQSKYEYILGDFRNKSLTAITTKIT
jgi:hypothetical protein